MTQINNNTNILSACTVVHVTCSLWTAKARLSREDLDPVTVSQLPPEALASLGSKQLIDPTLLKPIVAIKTRLFRTMDVKGTKFLGGWIIHTDATDTVARLLQDMAAEYDAAVSDFLRDYDSHVASWLSQFPQWADIIRPALPTQTQLRRKFAFQFQMFQVMPVDSGQANDNLVSSVELLGDTALGEISTMLQRIRETTFDPTRPKFTARAFNAFDSVLEKINAAAFLHPSVGVLGSLLRSVLQDYRGRADDTQAMHRLGALVGALATPQAIMSICESFQTQPASVWDVIAQPAAAAPASQPVQQTVELPIAVQQQVQEIKQQVQDIAERYDTIVQPDAPVQPAPVQPAPVQPAPVQQPEQPAPVQPTQLLDNFGLF